MARPTRIDGRVDTALAGLCVLLSLAFLVLPDPTRQRIAGAVRGTLVAPFAGLQQRAELSRRAFLVHDSTSRVADSVILRSQRLEAIEAENARLRGLLGLGRALTWGFIPTEALRPRGPGDELTLVLSAGARAGVERYSPVVATEGLVGMIESVDATTSVAIVWPHPDLRVSAMSADGGAFGIVAAHPGTGAERYLLELRGVPFRSQLKVGIPVVTSGLGGVHPRGILIGTVIQELKTAEGWARSYLLRPAVKPMDATSVMILSPDRARAGVESVWRPSVDSLLRRVVGAGDSLAMRARDSLMATLRQKLLDSLDAETPPLAPPDSVRRP